MRREVLEVMRLCDTQTNLKEAVTWSLSQPGRALSSESSFRWSTLTLLVSDSCGEDWRRVLPAAAAIELWLTAGDVFDEIEDGDDPGLWRVVGIPQAANAATALLFMSQQAVLRLENMGYDAPAVLGVARALSEGGLHSVIGQHEDLLSEGLARITEQDYFRMTEQKSGSLIGAACKVGAMLAGRKDVVAAYEAAGQNIGICAQILNDIRSFRADSFGKTDVERHKKTLPLIYATEHAEGVDWVCLEAAGRQYGESRDMDGRVAEVLDKVGAFDYSWVVADAYAQRAVRELESARAKRGLVNLVKELLAA